MKKLSKRAKLGACAAALAAAATAISVTTASADAPQAHPSVAHPEQDYMGSQVRLHMPQVKTPAPRLTDTVPGLDVSGWQGNVDWGTVAANGAKFAYVKATESIDYTSDYFSQQYDGSYGAGIIRGAYHFATPNTASGADQANFFVDHGGGWSQDGMTLPGMLDIEWNPYGDTCYGLDQASMAGWIADFSNTYQARTGRWPAIYTATSWWNQCVGDAGAGFGANSPLVIANYNGSPGALPAGWDFQTIWQFADSGTFPGDQDQFNGDYSRVQALANG